MYINIFNYNNLNLEFEILLKSEELIIVDELKNHDLYRNIQKKTLINIKKAIESLIEEKYIIKDSIEYDSKELFTTPEVF